MVLSDVKKICAGAIAYQLGTIKAKVAKIVLVVMEGTDGAALGMNSSALKLMTGSFDPCNSSHWAFSRG